MKPIIRGLIDRQGEPNKNMLDVVHAYVVKVNWADLQPKANGPIAADNAIDKAIARVRQSDYKQVGMALKLRVFAGVNAPSWVKDLGGAPIQYTNTQEGGSIGGGTIGRFWNTASQQAYAQLQQKLAAKYDSVPEIRELTMSGCTTLFDEPFVRQPASGNAQKLAAAGYTEAADKSCIVSAIEGPRGVEAHHHRCRLQPVPGRRGRHRPTRRRLPDPDDEHLPSAARRPVRTAEQRAVDRQAGQPGLHPDVRGDVEAGHPADLPDRCPQTHRRPGTDAHRSGEIRRELRRAARAIPAGRWTNSRPPPQGSRRIRHPTELW